MFCFYPSEVPRVVKVTEKESRIVITRSWGWRTEDWGAVAVAVLHTEFQLGVRKSFSIWMVVRVAQLCEYIY